MNSHKNRLRIDYRRPTQGETNTVNYNAAVRRCGSRAQLARKGPKYVLLTKVLGILRHKLWSALRRYELGNMDGNQPFLLYFRHIPRKMGGYSR